MIRDLFRDYFASEAEFEKFAGWAFGHDWEDICKGGQLIQAWNDVHYWQYTLSYHGDLPRDADIIVDIYRKRK